MKDNIAVKDNNTVQSATRPYNEPVVTDKQQTYAQNTTQQHITIAEPANEKALETAAIAGVQNNAGVNTGTGLETASVTSAVKAVGQQVQTVAYVSSAAQEVEDENVYIANTSVDKKNKLRGLFRKVTRVFEKTTNLPVVQEKGILIGSFEIALK